MMTVCVNKETLKYVVMNYIICYNITTLITCQVLMNYKLVDNLYFGARKIYLFGGTY